MILGLLRALWTIGAFIHPRYLWRDDRDPFYGDLIETLYEAPHQQEARDPR